MALGGFLFNYVVDRTLAENHPSKDYEQCVNRHQVKHPCTVCADICPQHVYAGTGSQDEADFRCCTNCNLCAAACPSRCIASSSTNATTYLKLLKALDRTVLIASSLYEGEAHLKVDSFAVLPWEYLACLGLHKKVVFLTTGLPETTPFAEAVWRKTRANLEIFFGKEGFKRRFVFSDQPIHEEGNEPELSRRDLFRRANDGLKSTISSVIPSAGTMDGLLYRQLLQQILDKSGDVGSFGWVIPTVTSKCKGCAVCEKLCPQKAIAVKKENKQFRILFDPVRCNNCGLCEKTCPFHAIDGPGLVHIKNLNPLILLEGSTNKK